MCSDVKWVACGNGCSIRVINITEQLQYKVIIMQETQQKISKLLEEVEKEQGSSDKQLKKTMEEESSSDKQPGSHDAQQGNAFSHLIRSDYNGWPLAIC